MHTYKGFVAVWQCVRSQSGVITVHFAGDKFEILADDASDEEEIADLDNGIFTGEFV